MKKFQKLQYCQFLIHLIHGGLSLGAVKNLLPFLLMLCTTGLMAQVSPGVSGPDGASALRLVERHKLSNASRLAMPGYRVQVYFGNERSKAMELRTELIRLFPEQGAYLLFQQPNFKVRAGDFRTRLEAAGFLEKVSVYFKGAFIVPDEVRLPDL